METARGTVELEVTLSEGDRKAVQRIVGKDAKVLKDAKLLVKVEVEVNPEARRDS